MRYAIGTFDSRDGRSVRASSASNIRTLVAALGVYRVDVPIGARCSRAEIPGAVQAVMDLS